MTDECSYISFFLYFLWILVFFDSFKNTIHRSHHFNRCSSNENNKKRLVLEFSIYVMTCSLSGDTYHLHNYNKDYTYGKSVILHLPPFDIENRKKNYS
jgi:hypothetical protein